MEIWCNLKDQGFSRYSVSSLGRIRNNSTMKIMKYGVDPSGRRSILLISDAQPWRQTRVGIDTLVDLCFKRS